MSENNIVACVGRDSVNKKSRTKRIIGKVLIYALLILISIFFLFPFFVMLCLSVLSDRDINLQVLFSPTGTIYLGTYLKLLAPGSKYVGYILNTLQVALITAIGVPLISSLCAYGFSKMEFKGRDVMFGVVLGTMMIPSVIGLIPLYAIYASLGWVNTLYPLWVPALFGGGATNIFLMRQFMRGIPNEMLEAAKLDGANAFILYLKFTLPLCFPILLYVAVMSFIGSWNDYLGPFTYLNSNSEHITLALGIYFEYGPGTTSLANVAMAAGVLMMVPCAILFFIFQKYLIEGVAMTGIKA